MWYLKNIRPICSIAGKKKLFFLPLNELTVPRVFRPYQFCLVILTPFNLHSHAVKKTTTLQRSPTLFRKMLVSKKHVLTTSSPIFYWDKKKKKNITKVKPSNASDSRHWLEVLFKKKKQRFCRCQRTSKSRSVARLAFMFLYAFTIAMRTMVCEIYSCL